MLRKGNPILFVFERFSKLTVFNPLDYSHRIFKYEYPCLRFGDRHRKSVFPRLFLETIQNKKKIGNETKNFVFSKAKK